MGLGHQMIFFDFILRGLLTLQILAFRSSLIPFLAPPVERIKHQAMGKTSVQELFARWTNNIKQFPALQHVAYGKERFFSPKSSLDCNGLVKAQPQMPSGRIRETVQEMYREMLREKRRRAKSSEQLQIRYSVLLDKILTLTSKGPGKQNFLSNGASEYASATAWVYLAQHWQLRRQLQASQVLGQILSKPYLGRLRIDPQTFCVQMMCST